MTDTSADASLQPTNAEWKSKKLPRPALAPWQVFLLTFFTFGFYAPFWMAAAAADLRRMGVVKTHQWRWFLAPIFAFVLYFAVSRLMGFYEKLGDTRRDWTNIISLVALAALVVNMAYGATSGFDTPTWISTLLLAGVSMTFAWIQKHISIAKESLAGVEFSRPHRKLSVLHIVVLVIFVPLVTLILGVLIYDEYNIATTAKLTPNTPYTDEALGMRFTPVGDGWHEVDIGTWSDGSAVAEYNGPLIDMSIVAFDQSDNDSIDDTLLFRLRNDLKGLDCEPSAKRFIGDTLRVEVDVWCTATNIEGRQLIGSRIVEGEDGRFVELVADVTSSRNSYREVFSNMKATVRSFEFVESTREAP